ncbi:hypothetical protein Q3G72_032488 [Acer saccharum]|nr:hypothetical protein Q3G72_032488 [Acer saccharum]
MSYAEVVNEFIPYKKEAEKGLKEPEKSISLTWSGTYEVEEWLSRSAVGTLKNFGSLELVNRKLDDRGFEFSSTFRGGKDIVWTFQSQFEKDSFVNNHFLWKDCFSSMMEWSEKAQSTELNEIRWVEVHGVPLNCWCKEFFHKLGGQVGEVLWIDRATECKLRLDIGKLLVLAPVGQVLA